MTNIAQGKAILWLSLQWIFLNSIIRSTLGQDASIRAIGLIVDLEKECVAPMNAADADSNSVLSQNEYIAYAQSYVTDPNLNLDAFSNTALSIVLEYNQWTCAGYCNFLTGDVTIPSNSNRTQPSCLSTCRDGIPLEPPENVRPDSFKTYVYNVCVNTIARVKQIENSTDVVDGPTIVTKDVVIPFGMANLKNLDAGDIANDAEGSLKQILLPTLSDLFSLVKTNLFVERLGGRLRRKLELSAVETWVKTIDNRSCPGSIQSNYPNALCQHLTGVFTISFPGEDLDTIGSQVSNQAQRYIRDGDFQSLLPDEASDEYIFYSLEPTTGGSFPLFAIVGVAAGAVLIGLFAGRALIVNRRRRGSQVPDDDLDSDEADFRTSANITAGSKSIDLEQGESVARGTFGNVDRISLDGSESDIGSSGWSSSAGMSSLNTGASVDSAEILVSSLAAIGAASHVHKKYSTESKNSEVYPVRGNEESSQSESSELNSDSELHLSPGRQERLAISRKDLEKQIEKGDWAAVGATAALLASESRSSVGSISSGFSSEFSASSSSAFSSAISGTSLDRARAAELDRLVEAGDWEGVVLTAAKFEAESDRDDKTEGSVSGKSSFKSAADRSFANLSGNSPSVSTNLSDSLKRAEIRAEVESLVRRVVPDEIENVDEMMTQFKDREEELLETLRTMQERSIAARQREASRRNAKREAKKLAKEAKKASGVGLPPRSTPSKTTKNGLETESLIKNQDNAHLDVKSDASKDESNLTESTPHRKALDEAIAAGDWEAVGRTAEQIGELADSSVNTSDFESAASDNDLDTSAYLSTQSRHDSDRATELEELIERRDWSGVVAAASRFSVADSKEKKATIKSVTDDVDSKSTGSIKSAKRKSIFGGKQNDDESDQSSNSKILNKNLSKEEKEARAQAEIWNAIAEQSKMKGSNAIGASDAADWAISRSLKQLMDSTPENKQVETQSVGSSSDDRSV